ncbi:nitrite reductase large subunit NirB [Pelagibacterium halotolerans]|uniref:Nitrite reductase (NAD(P)H) large subunit n=1 Tax=Pelagibacterium halotolerans (strain DSM 22347 / JCM 15775 / CGMCC 1.7692 / B2) TaxID=1082931 RepID=G4R894_PELHB|nr:nitrite reductase large subunit NirB [Pelagibacterium halotolerans]AEQ52338.1 nitrite reductase (NAD(P)H) large subunit [Pelagibacterium halotolerans B2]QJR17922.1 NAD(P)/FAD-dependent oxidoreductase [Pelagibacterium halotolerans]SEA33708.1 assimilatory nitrite reductase (NAD(P)H) large subunit precursor [Pelagibacterium halotolerans]
MTEKLVVIGAGMASGRMLEHLFETDPSRYQVTLFGAEPRGNYNRIMLSPVLSGEKSYEDIITHDADWYAANGVDTRFGQTVTRIDRAARTVHANGVETPYDKLVVATGSAPFIIPIAGKDLPGVMAFRDLDDVEKMVAASTRPNARAVVIGGGLLGLEAAAALRNRGMEVVVLHLMGHLMERQLDPAAGYLLQRELEKRGITIHCKAQTKAILGDERVEAVLLEDGTVYQADIVVMAAGIRPETRIATDAGIHVERGIVVDDQMRTSDADILALGECVEHQSVVYGLVAPLYDMAKVAAKTLTGTDAAFKPVKTATQLKVTGVNLYSAGDFAEGEGREEIVLRDAAAGVYKRLVLEDDKVIGTVLYGETGDGAWFFDLIKKAESISAMRDTLIFGQAYQGGAELDPMAAVAALPDDAEICGCNGVCKSAITGAIASKGLNSLDGVRAHTKASASCGSCTGLVEKLLAATLGDSYNPAAVQPICPCTDLGHDDVRRLIVAKDLKSIPAVMQELEWKTSCGCAKCRPALNYYLLSTWPGEYEDDNQSRFINERVHANIQKDGTYSVVPRMWGGITNPRELRAIADVADKFAIPTIKVTGGQRIDLLGVKKEDLPAVWGDLNAAGMVSGAAYAKGLRTVKTCVGSDWCRFGTQDSTGLGVRIEKFMWGSWTPAKVKMAVSGCPRNCAEATCKDVGVICVDSGYEIHFAGAAGLDIKGTEVLCHARTEDEALEIIVALTQLYREQGRYLERIYKWAKRVGSASIKANIVDDFAKRRRYYERFVYSQKFAQVDPWEERVNGKDAHEFAAMAEFGFPQAAE